MSPHLTSAATKANILKYKISHAFNRAASTYDAAAVLQREVGNRMLERLKLMRINPQRIIDLGCNTGYFTKVLAKQYSSAQVFGIDIAWNMVNAARKKAGFFGKQRFIAADADYLPFADHSIDLIFSDLAIQWCPDLSLSFSEFRRVLKPKGVLLFATYGPDTLKEVREAWATLDRYEHVNPFVDMHDLGDMLLHCKFADPVVDMEMFTLTYKKADDLFKELRALGAKNIAKGRQSTLTGKAHFQAMIKNYEKVRTAKQLFPCTYEIIYGHAWGPNLASSDVLNEQGFVAIPLSRIGGLNKKNK